MPRRRSHAPGPAPVKTNSPGAGLRVNASPPRTPGGADDDYRNPQEGWEANVYSKRDGKIRKVFASQAEAKNWRVDALTAIGKGQLRAPKPTTVQQAWDAWLEGAKAGTIRNRSGDSFKPSALRSYERAMRLRVLPELGPVRLADLHRPALQELADELLANELSPSAIRVTFLPLRALLRRAIGRGELAVNPCDGLELAAVRGGRDRVADPIEAESLIEAVPITDRAVWATAMYAGLRRGELQALRVDRVDLAFGVIALERGWDEKEGEIELKSHAGRRRVPIAGVLRDHLAEHLIRSGRKSDELIFGRTVADPFAPKGYRTARIRRGGTPGSSGSRCTSAGIPSRA